MNNMREISKRYWISYYFIKAIKFGKLGYHKLVNDNIECLHGALLYMSSVGDISEEQYNRVMNLSFKVRARYYK